MNELVFNSPIGACVITYGENEKIVGVRLCSRKKVNIENSHPRSIKKIAQRLKAHLSGKHDSFKDLEISIKGTEFQLSVYEEARKIPVGEYISYKELAIRVGKPKGARAVGNALGKNPIPLIVPCHRILTSSNCIGGFSADGGIKIKEQILKIEGAL